MQSKHCELLCNRSTVNQCNAVNPFHGREATCPGGVCARGGPLHTITRSLRESPGHPECPRSLRVYPGVAGVSGSLRPLSHFLHADSPGDSGHSERPDTPGDSGDTTAECPRSVRQITECPRSLRHAPVGYVQESPGVSGHPEAAGVSGSLRAPGGCRSLPESPGTRRVVWSLWESPASPRGVRSLRKSPWRFSRQFSPETSGDSGTQSRMWRSLQV